MADTQPMGDDEFKELADAFAADEAENPIAPASAEVLDKPTTQENEEPKNNDATPPADKKDATPTPADPAQTTEENGTQAQDPAAPGEPEVPSAPAPLTREDMAEIITKIRDDERMSTQDTEVATNEVMEAYYPGGVSNVLVDQNTGKELRTPKDVVDASGGEMSMEEAAQWLMNEQYKLDNEIAKIKNDARTIAETTVKFKKDSISVLQRYDPLFKAYPQIQRKVWDQYSKLIKADEKRGVILQAPDMEEFYDTVLEPYRMAFEYSQKQPSTNPTPQPGAPAPSAPGTGDRLDEGGDGGQSPVDDPNDFAQQVNKELAKGI